MWSIDLSLSSYDFANILFSGKCNAKCPYCIGNSISQVWNLDDFPLKNFDTFLHEVNEKKIWEIIFTGTNTDPLLYRHQQALVEDIRTRCGSWVRLALHSNGFLLEREPSLLRLYDKCTLSIPSFDPDTFSELMGTKQKVLDLIKITENTSNPIKLSRIVTERNNTFDDTKLYLKMAMENNIKRIAFRKVFWEFFSWHKTIDFLEKMEAVYTWEFRSNPVYMWNNIEITLWSFDNTTSKSINLFSDGRISGEYLITR